MLNIRIGGVPEHFNLPFRLVAEAGTGTSSGVEIDWRDYPGGSGAMAAALDDGELDVAILLTEAAVAASNRGVDCEILSLYTESPLIWGLHVPADSAFASENDLRGCRYAISRHGSGSHLMAFAHARSKGWPADRLRFVEVGSLDGAIEAFAEHRADVFFWEKFMTQPVVDDGRFRRVGVFTAPWPAFVSCASKRALALHRDAITATLTHVATVAANYKERADAIDLITSGYGLTASDAREWLGTTRWAERLAIDPAMIEDVADVLIDVGVIQAGPDLGSAETHE